MSSGQQMTVSVHAHDQALASATPEQSDTCKSFTPPPPQSMCLNHVGVTTMQEDPSAGFEASDSMWGARSTKELSTQLPTILIGYSIKFISTID
jgi:hypothetical protein